MLQNVEMERFTRELRKTCQNASGEHNTTNKCRYTRFRKPLKLIYKEFCFNYSEACKREAEIKGFSRKKKYALLIRSLAF